MKQDETEASSTAEQPKPSEADKLKQEKIKLAKKIGLWGTYAPEKGYRQTNEYQRIKEIDKRLSEISNG
ncbi:hypothetical protein DFQ01_103235 [Paenibacillus cellulosilyticus]|uniref:Uncharacterized protein n=1 Tax=Paenibacillus cellulosilyticus TaxID=375489 RepID=A0A2V2YXG6_9BACL|nr:hypothetical protein [Paenibacillus cellulosilyticus]PWW06333.1 hypothetical protein DFQ01_103235 [Paenibacillus cellulosilyticus]QKS42924.1 hypothetical protein HUB94_00015 [Paenibacillus cellulosilyticus]QKS43451.1 hypothetical protein HUB94_02695 [Paenibacillus cellulosilyticus]QKS46315.1 hypothetical protein HUB94_19060 [Paenibacillus cellulosilyticus]